MTTMRARYVAEFENIAVDSGDNVDEHKTIKQEQHKLLIDCEQLPLHYTSGTTRKHTHNNVS
jgi:hypothetical protein